LVRALADTRVAASALVDELELWTLNGRHFPMFESLQARW
jgi:predicted nucleic acid-binding protein